MYTNGMLSNTGMLLYTRLTFDEESSVLGCVFALSFVLLFLDPDPTS
jgi:hypothetical protein